MLWCDDTSCQMAGDRTACEEGVRDRSQCSLPHAGIAYTGSLGPMVGVGGVACFPEIPQCLCRTKLTHSTWRVNDNLGGGDTGVGETQRHINTRPLHWFSTLWITQAPLVVGGRLWWIFEIALIFKNLGTTSLFKHVSLICHQGWFQFRPHCTTTLHPFICYWNMQQIFQRSFMVPILY